jgi:glycosyltransferase involved in cell wall biosynthesis
LCEAGGATIGMHEEIRVSIGLPVRNGAAYLREALESLLAQTHRNFELIISDNASTDATPQICQEFLGRDKRIRYSRNDTDVGSTGNFLKTLGLATSEYFMWAAHDDTWAPRFIEANLRELVGHDDVIASISRVKFIDVRSWIWERFWAPYGTAPLLGSVKHNIFACLWRPGTNTRMYALFRKHILADCLDIAECWGADTAFVVKSLKYGKYQEVGDVLLFRRRGMSRNMRRFVWENNRTWLGKVFPFWDCTLDILRLAHVPKSLPVFLALAKLNTLHTLWYFKCCAEDTVAWLSGSLRPARAHSLAPHDQAR